MYQGDNPIAMQSQRWISEALVALMHENTFTQITIKMICLKADLSRQTFYNFFETKEDVLRFCLRSNYEKLFEELNAKKTVTIEEMIFAFARELEIDSELIRIIIDNRLETLVGDEIARCVELFADRFSLLPRNDKRLSYSKAFISGALSRILLHWIKSENPISVQELMKIILSILSGEFLLRGK